MEGSIESFIVDASYVIARIMPDEDEGNSVRRKFAKFGSGDISFFSTKLLPFEVINSIRSAVLRSRFDDDTAKEVFEEFKLLEIPLLEIDFNETLGFALEHNISCYDASYTYLSTCLHCELLSKDRKLVDLAKEQTLAT